MRHEVRNALRIEIDTVVVDIVAVAIPVTEHPLTGHKCQKRWNIEGFFDSLPPLKRVWEATGI